MSEKMKIEKNKFYVISLGQDKIIESTKEDAIKALMEMVNKSKADATTLNPEIVEVDTSGEKWSLKGLPWNLIAIELMRNQKPNKEA